MEKYGIETLKKFALILIRLGMKLEKVKGIKSIIFALIPFLFRNFKNIKELWKNREQIALEFKDISEIEKIELHGFISTQLKLQNSVIEKLIEAGLDAMNVISEKILTIINLIKNGKR